MCHSCVDDSDERRIWLYVFRISDQNLGVAVGRKVIPSGEYKPAMTPCDMQYDNEACGAHCPKLWRITKATRNLDACSHKLFLHFVSRHFASGGSLGLIERTTWRAAEASVRPSLPAFQGGFGFWGQARHVTVAQVEPF